MTYRYDSTFFHPYGRLYNTKPHPTDEKKLRGAIEAFGKNNAHLAKGKSKKVAWFVSNCYSQSGREKYVKKLQQYIQVRMDMIYTSEAFALRSRGSVKIWKQSE